MTISKEMKALAREQMDGAFATLGCSELSGDTDIVWNNRFTSRMGDARYDKKGGRHRIRLAAKLWPNATNEQRETTVIHETCHIVDFHMAHKNGESTPSPHGLSWKMLMNKCGQTPKRTHDVLIDGVRVYCGCTTHMVSTIIANRLANGKNYRCTLCGSRLETKEALMSGVT